MTNDVSQCVLWCSGVLEFWCPGRSYEIGRQCDLTVPVQLTLTGGTGVVSWVKIPTQGRVSLTRSSEISLCLDNAAVTRPQSSQGC